MGIIKQNSRLSHHRLTAPGATFTVPPTEDFTSGSWTATDLCLGEIGININDDTIFFRSLNGIIEIATASAFNSLWDRTSDGDLQAVAQYSPSVDPDVLHSVTAAANLGNTAYEWNIVYANTIASYNRGTLTMEVVGGSPIQQITSITLNDSGEKKFRGIPVANGYTGTEEVTVQNATTIAVTSLPAANEVLSRVTIQDGDVLQITAKVIGKTFDGLEMAVFYMSAAFYQTGGVAFRLGSGTDYITANHVELTQAYIDVDPSGLTQDICVYVNPSPDAGTLPQDMFFLSTVTYTKLNTNA